MIVKICPLPHSKKKLIPFVKTKVKEDAEKF